MNLAVLPHAAPFVVPPPVAVADVRVELDRFRCEPYAATISVRTCLARRAAATSRKDADGNYRQGDYGLCRGCADGAAITARLGVTS